MIFTMKTELKSDKERLIRLDLNRGKFLKTIKYSTPLINFYNN